LKQGRSKGPPATQNASQKSSEGVGTKMHQIRFRLGLCPKIAGGSQRSPRSPSWIKGVLLIMDGDEGEGKEGTGKGKKGEERGKGRMKGRGGGKIGGRLRHGFWGMDAPSLKYFITVIIKTIVSRCIL